MTYIDDKQLQGIWKVVGSVGCMKMLRVVSEYEPIKYSNIFLRAKAGTGLTAFYIHKLVKHGLLKREGGMYMLTRIGVQVVKVIHDFEKICKKYDISDCDADSVIQTVVKRNERFEAKVGDKKLIVEVR